MGVGTGPLLPTHVTRTALPIACPWGWLCTQCIRIAKFLDDHEYRTALFRALLHTIRNYWSCTLELSCLMFNQRYTELILWRELCFAAFCYAPGRSWFYGHTIWTQGTTVHAAHGACVPARRG